MSRIYIEIILGGHMILLFFTLSIAFIGGLMLQKLKIPGGMMLGAVVTVAILNIRTSWVDVPSGFRFVAQCIAGAYIGTTVQKENFRKIKNLLKPTLLLLTGLFAANLLSGFLIYLVSPLDLLTALFSAVPGGISDTPLIAADMGADATKVAVMQFVRLTSGLAIIPILVGKNKMNMDVPKEDIDKIEKSHYQKMKSRNLFMAVIIAFISGYVGKLSAIPAGTLLFAMLSIIILKLFSFEMTFPIWFKRLAQLFSGAYIGSHFGYQDVQELRYLIIPVLIVVTVNILACFMIGHLLHRIYKIPLSQAFLSSSPAGASDMALIASDIGVSSSDVAVIQIFRLLGAVTIFSQLINLFVKFLG